MAAASKTRVCIKNLPPNATEQDLKEFIKESSKISVEITDCKVLKNAKGRSRKVAFVGFRQENHARFVVDSFHRTFMGMSRLSVEPAMAKKEEKPKDGPAIDAEPEQDITGKKISKSSKNTDITKTKDFLSSLASGSKSKFWANDEGDSPVVDTLIEQKNSEDESDSDSSASSQDTDGDDTEGKKEIVEAAVSDMDFLRSKQKQIEDLESIDEPTKNPKSMEEAREDDMNTDSEEEPDSSSSDSSDSDRDDEDRTSVRSQEPITTQLEEREEEEDELNQKDMEDIKKEEISQSRLFVRNLPFGTTEEELEEYFSAIGTVNECHIPIDDQKRNKGFAFIQYSSSIDALEARRQLDKVDFQGRLLHILPARPAPLSSNTDKQNLTWKQRQELARKEKDTNGTGSDGAKGWSASFVRGDAVVDNLADRLGLRKGDFLGVKDKLSSGDAAVRLALGETQIIEENRSYFKEHGVDMEALVSAKGDEKTAKRSKTDILVKNLPYDTRVEELEKLFQMGDESVEILLPPSRTIALVQYGHSSLAKRAFRKLAYRRFKHVPIYLEWSPVAARVDGGAGDGAPTGRDGGTNNTPILEADEEHEAEGHAEGSGATLYVKNLNFLTTEDAVRGVFEKNVGGVVKSVRIPQKVAPAKRSGEEPQVLSMGYGFVELDSEASARTAIAKLQGKLVDGHAWEVTISNRRGAGTERSSPGASSGKSKTKLIVRNVPFQASRSEILKLFGTFGQLRRVRLPKKFDGSHRGFAFVEFLTGKEALAAMNALSRTHLYGRHLVLEWATDDDQDVGRLREKAKRSSAGAAVPQNKKIRFE